jgi:hypothetical protein
MKPKLIHSGKYLIRWLIPLFALLLSAFFTAHAQEVEKEAAIYLKNGNVIRGRLVMSMFDNYMTVKTSETDHMEIGYDKIDRIVFGKDVVKPKDTIPPFYLKPGFMHMTEAGLIAGNNDNGEGTAYSISTVNGYRFNPYFGVGLGIGIDGYNRITMMPIFLSFRGNLKKSNVTPFYFLNAGYSAAWENDNLEWIEYDYVRGGFMLQPGLGYMFAFKNMAMYFNLGYKIQQSEIAYNFQNGWATPTEIQEERTRKRLTMSIGIAF